MYEEGKSYTILAFIGSHCAIVKFLLELFFLVVL
jgi:hypothetical protein